MAYKSNSPARTVICASALAVVVRLAPASAQTDTDLAIRRQLIDDASRAARGGDHQTALDLAQRAAQIRMTPSLRAFLATEFVANRRFVEATAAASQCTVELRRDATAPDRERLLQSCDESLRAATAQVGRVSIDGLDPRTPGLVVRIGAEPLNLAALGVAITANPGTAVIEVEAPGYRPVRREVTVVTQQVTHVAITLEREVATLPSDSRTSSAVDPRATNATTATTGSAVATTSMTAVSAHQRSQPVDNRQPLRLGPILLLTAGGLAAVTSTAMFAAQVVTYGDCMIVGNENLCTNTPIESARPAETYNRVAIASAAGAGALIAAGVVWWLVTPQPAARRRAWVAPTTTGIVIGGAL